MTGGRRYEAIVIGTSAGGLYVLSFLLERLPADFPFPVIIVQHRMNDQQELLEEILQAKCRLPVKQADEKEKITKGIVYLAPPGYHLLVESDRTFSLSIDKPVSYSRPSIDVLFETAAHVFRESLIGIILTGANKDGAAGIEAISEKGGLTIAQNPDEAQYPPMPLAAIATRTVRRICTLEEISNFLLKISTA